MWVSSYRCHSPGAAAPAPPPPEGYDIDAVIAAIRADSKYGTYFSDTSDPNAPNGLQAPTLPTITSSVTVSSLAALAASIGNGVHVTLDPGNYTVASAIPAIDVGAFNDVQITLTGCSFNCNKVMVAGGLHINYRANRVRIIGGTFDAGYEIYGDDIKLEHMSFPIGTGESPEANHGFVAGRRICWEHCTTSQHGGGPGWAGDAILSQITGTISGTTLTVTSVTGRPVDTGGLGVLSYVFGNGGSSTIRGMRILEQLTGSPGSTGTYRLSKTTSTTASTTWWVLTRSTCIILANCDASETVGTGAYAGAHEHVSRFNGSHFGVQVDCRMSSQAGGGGAKATMRTASSSTTELPCGTMLQLRVQAEGACLETFLVAGIYPSTEKFFVDDCREYRTPISVATNGGPAINPIPIAEPFLDLGVGEGTSISGDGTTVTLVFRSSQKGHGCTTGDICTIFGAQNAAYNASNVSVTVIDPYTLTYSSAATGACAFLSLRTPYENCALFQMWNTLSYSAPDIGTNGAGWTCPSGVDSSWSTVVDAATAAANGNFYMTWVPPPAWSFH